MLPSLSGGLRLALVLALSVGYVAWHGHAHSAFAKGGGGDDGGDDGEDGGDDDAGGVKGGGDEGDEPDEDDKDQPPVTSGGLFTLDTYPTSELARPLTMIEGVTQVKLGTGTDVSAKGAFASAGLNLEGVYGMTDNFTLRAGMTSAYNFHQYAFYAGFEGAIVYNTIDFRAGLRLSRFANALRSNFCAPPAAGDAMDPATMADCGNPMATIVNLPNGKYVGQDVDFGVDIGFPFRYVAKPEIAIVALDTLMTINLNGRKPDLLPSLGISTNPIPALSVVIFAQLQIRNFDTTNGLFIPATARAEFSPTNRFDLGLEFTFLNLKPANPDEKFYDSRFINLFVQARM
ncbi:MAG: hypothetical protein JWO36_1679 [Myxococcales bacterium]|nr:hypothetical protein [Myxococcales bacterium]